MLIWLLIYIFLWIVPVILLLIYSFNLSHLGAHMVNRLLCETWKSILKMFNCWKLKKKNVTLQILNFILISYIIKKKSPYGVMLILSLFQVTALNNTKSKENLTLHHMGKSFSSKFIVIKFIIWSVAFLLRFLPLTILGWTYGFRTVDNLPRAHWYATDFSYIYMVEWNYITETSPYKSNPRSAPNI